MLQSGDYLQAAKNVLQRHGGLWFQDESFVVVRVAEELSAGNSTKPYSRLANNDQFQESDASSFWGRKQQFK